MQVIIAEKPALGRAIAKAIPGTEKNENECIFKGNYAIIWAYGHLLTLKDPEDYDEKYANWNLNDLPIFFDNWEQKPNDKKGDSSHVKRLNQIKTLLKSAESVINAGDPDEEGQFLVDEIIQWCGFKGPVYRMNTADTTEHALQKALDNLKDNKPMEKIGLSAYARSVADKAVGYNMTRYYTCENPPAMLSIGRVQTPTLGLVVNRDLAIEGHKKTFYYEITGNMTIDDLQVPFKYVPKKDDPSLTDGKMLDKNYAESIVGRLYANPDLDPVMVSKKTVSESAPLPFNLVELQSYCSKKFKYDPSDVMEITQELREKYNAITYNRSDCQYLSEEQYKEAGPTMQQIIENIRFNPPGLDMSLHSRCFNDNNITAHTAIIPTNQKVDLTKLTDRQRNVYLAICKYYMAQFMPPAIKERTGLEVVLTDGGKLTSSSTKLLSPGYLYLFQKDLKSGDIEKEERSALSELDQGLYKGTLEDAKVVEKETKPPARYTKATLNKDMTRIAKFVDDPDVKELLLKKDKDKKGENGSIGTVATRADIIDKLIMRGFLEQDSKKHLISTPLGRELYRILPDELRKPDMTAHWWAIQEDIKSGQADVNALTGFVFDMIKDFLTAAHPKVDMSLIPANLLKGKGAPKESIGICPRCGSSIVEGKNGYGCSGYRDGCKFVIWKKPKLSFMSKSTITTNDAKKLLEGKKVLKKNLLSKAGKKFEAYIYLEDDPQSPYGPSIKLEFKKNTKKGGGSSAR